MLPCNSKSALIPSVQNTFRPPATEKAAAAQQMSNVEVLKQANAIDGAVMTNALSDDEKPSDFISDCREVVNLLGGFNNQGRMRVGGRRKIIRYCVLVTGIWIYEYIICHDLKWIERDPIRLEHTTSRLIGKRHWDNYAAIEKIKSEMK